MRQRIVTAGLSVIGSMLMLAVIGAGAVGLGLRYRWPVVLDGLRRFSRTTINPGQMETAGEAGAYASIIEHTGRISGRDYRTPIVARPVDDGFVVSLTYGARADWVRNVLTTGTATLITEGVTHEHLRVAVVAIEETNEWISAAERRLLRWFGIEKCLRLNPERDSTS